MLNRDWKDNVQRFPKKAMTKMFLNSFKYNEKYNGNNIDRGTLSSFKEHRNMKQLSLLTDGSEKTE